VQSTPGQVGVAAKAALLSLLLVSTAAQLQQSVLAQTVGAHIEVSVHMPAPGVLHAGALPGEVGLVVLGHDL
jgi:hypothetical protein